MGCIQLLEVDDWAHLPILLLHQKDGADEAWWWRVKWNLFYGPLLEQSCHLCVDQGVVHPLQWSGEASSRECKRRCGREGGMVTLHGLEKMRGRLQFFLPEGEEVAQSAPDPQMVVGQAQIKRELWQGEGSGLGTLTLEPPPLPPLTDSLLLLALPLLGGRAVRFSRGPVAGTALRLL
jgi:hypothetical protein